MPFARKDKNSRNELFDWGVPTKSLYPEDLETMRKSITSTTIRIYIFLLIYTGALFLLQGFKFHGFDLGDPLLHWIGAATVGVIGGLIGSLYTFYYTKDHLLTTLLKESRELLRENEITEETFLGIINAGAVSLSSKPKAKGRVPSSTHPEGK